MKLLGFSATMGSNLSCSSDDSQWHLIIRRNDDKSHDPFIYFHEKEVLPSDIEKFAPNWDKLNWTEIEDPIFLARECYAKDFEFKLTIKPTGSSAGSCATAVEDFHKFMRNA